MNNKTTATLPLKVSEQVSILEQQFLGTIRRTSPNGTFESVEPKVEQVEQAVVEVAKPKKASKSKKVATPKAPKAPKTKK